MSSLTKRQILIPIVAICGIALAPIALSLVGMVLSSLFQCRGQSYIDHCEVEAATGLVSALVSMAWLAIVTVPLGGIAFVLFAIYIAIRTPGK